MNKLKTKAKEFTQLITRSIWNLAHASRKLYWRTFKIKTRGVRVAVLRPASDTSGGEEILLIQHRYGGNLWGGLWVMPGGGVDKFETPQNAGRRELFEETGLDVDGELIELGIFQNNKDGRNDTVFVFVAEKVKGEAFDSSFEVSSIGWHPLWALPEGTSRATRNRVAEIEAWRRGELSFPIKADGQW